MRRYTAPIKSATTLVSPIVPAHVPKNISLSVYPPSARAPDTLSRPAFLTSVRGVAPVNVSVTKFVIGPAKASTIKARAANAGLIKF